MVRPKEFDPAVVVDNAMTAFWSKGFAATTAQDLVDSTGLGRGSLYNTFSSKAALFLEALRRYDDQWTRRQAAMLTGKGAVRDRIRTLLMTVVVKETSPGEPDGPRGCLAVNAAVELADRDPEVRALVKDVFVRMENALCAAIEEGRSTGELADGLPARDLACYVLNSMYGLRVLGKTADRAALERVVEVVLAAL
ncbi:TetR/AcrR family transcriptional regulator [Solihabitans fulvus]|uniref:TetR/AcrR family transcriptional regulator n=1 Tax=Solihabitans fulvus TaxID=1892852 RepID=A0A5B2WSV4_9PSEU|nr:TetR/AcrR family transcriptional regulator [Solihabitans fulvus]KAA2253910.1 TetR/AcrR family transcriptional regulator [Solihabitans fulvus]